MKITKVLSTKFIKNPNKSFQLTGKTGAFLCISLRSIVAQKTPILPSAECGVMCKSKPELICKFIKWSCCLVKGHS